MRTTTLAFRCPRAARLSPLAAAIGLALAPSVALAVSTTVTSTASSGAGSLYQAIQDANSDCLNDPNPVIDFAGSGAFVISQPFNLPTFFCNGPYNPTVNGGGSINGASPVGFDHHALLDGSGSNTCGFTFPQNFTYGGQLTVTGMRIQNFTYGSLAAGVCGQMELHNNLLMGNTVGALANSGTAIVGDSATGGNVIIGNEYGVWVNNSVTIENNKIGTANGVTAAANNYGVYVSFAGSVSIDNNLISGNTTSGVYFDNDYGGSVNGNYIGTTADGDGALPNGDGIYFNNGGSADLNGNIISGNAGAGVVFNYSSFSQLNGNTIGVGFSGSSLGNNRGVEAFCSGYIDLSGNTISANLGDGVLFNSTDAGYFSGNTITSNQANGVRITSGSCFQYGSFNDFWDNDISSNGQNGVLITGLSNNNNIHYGRMVDNGTKNISLNGGAATLPNDPGDLDGGPNDQQNWPVINSVVQGSSTTDINVTLDSNPSYLFEVQFYANDTLGKPGGEYFGSTFMYGGDTVTASLGGVYDNVSATATIIACCGPWPTSEFSPPKAALTAPAVLISPASKNFGFVEVDNSSPTTNFVIRSVGDQPYMIYDIQPGSFCYAQFGKAKAVAVSSLCTSGGFTCSTTCGFETEYATGTGCSVSVAFTPTFQGFQSDSICIQDNTAAGQHFIEFSGTGTPPPPLIIEPTSHDFGNVPVGGTSESMRFKVTNRTPYGSLPVTVGTTGGEFDVLADGCSPAIPPLSDCNIDVAFAPSASGDQQGELVVTGAAKPPSLGVAGFTLVQPEARASLQGVGVSGGQLQLPGAIDMGAGQVGGAPIGYTVELRNTGYGSLTIASIAVSSPFTLVNNCPATLAPAQACTILLGFQATSLGEVNGTLTVVTSAEGGSRAIPVVARGQTVATPLLRVQPTTLGFGSRVIGSQSASQQVTITNIGGATASVDLAMSTIDFLISGNNCGATLAPQASCSANVTFRPLGFGTRLGSFVVNGNAANAPQSVVITGTGCRPFAAGSSRFSTDSSCAP